MDILFLKPPFNPVLASFVTKERVAEPDAAMMRHSASTGDVCWANESIHRTAAAVSLARLASLPQYEWLGTTENDADCISFPRQTRAISKIPSGRQEEAFTLIK